MDQQTNLKYLADFSARNLDMIRMSAAGVEVFNILTVHVSPFFAIIFTTGEFLTPPATPSGKRHMTHFTEAALLGARPGEASRFLVGAKTFCSSSDEFDLAKGEKVALTRLLDQVRKDNPRVTNHAQRATAWAKYLTARKEQDERLFQDVLAQARAQAAAERGAANRANAEAALKAAAAGAKREHLQTVGFMARSEQALKDRLQQQRAGDFVDSFFSAPVPPRTRPQLEQNFNAGLAAGAWYR